MFWIEFFGKTLGGVLGLMVALMFAIAGFNMATNRKGKADQLANDYDDMLERDERRGRGWLHVNRGMSGDPWTYQATGWGILVVASIILVGGGIALVTHVITTLRSIP